MTFEEFFNLIFDILGGKKDIAVFMRELFDQILDLPSDGSVINPLYEKTAATLRKYVNPNDTTHYLPAKVVKEMHDYLEPAKFSAYIATAFSDTTRDDLTEALKPFVDGVTSHNVHDKCADLFKQILDEIIGINQKPEQLTLMSVAATSLPSAIAEKYSIRLLFETHGNCPGKGCINEMKEITESGSVEPTYIPTLIDSMSAPTFENIIALCPACNTRYLAEQKSGDSQKSMHFLQDKKLELMEEQQAYTVLSQYSIEQGVDRLLRKIASELIELSSADLEAMKLNYDPVKVRQKIPDDTLEQKMLLRKVLQNVREYFNLVDLTLKNLNKEQVIRQNMFSRQIKTIFMDLDETTIDGEPLPQTLIFNKLVNWLHEKTDEDIDICAIVISFFVQSCEVFNAIP